MMNSKIITSTCILSLAFLLGACGPIDETFEKVEFTEVTTSEITTSTTTALTGSTTAVSTSGSTVTTLVSTTAVTTVTDGSTAVGTITAETEAEKQEEINSQDSVQDNVQDVVAAQPSEMEIKIEDTKYNESNSETPTSQAVTTTATETAIVTTAETTPTVTETETIVTEEYVVYKPSTKYAHRSTCRWNKDDAYRCDDFSELETRICTECNPDVGDHIEYQAPSVDSGDRTYVGSFTATYYPETAYYPGVCGGSGRTLLGYGNYDNGIRGSIASRSLWGAYGYDRNGRTTVYLEFPSYPEMNGLYFLDDCSAYCGIIDVFVWSEWACPFGQAGVISAECWIS